MTDGVTEIISKRREGGREGGEKFNILWMVTNEREEKEKAGSD